MQKSSAVMKSNDEQMMEEQCVASAHLFLCGKVASFETFNKPSVFCYFRVVLCGQRMANSLQQGR